MRYDSPNLGGFTGSVQVGGRDTGGDNGGDLAQQRRHAYVVTAGGLTSAGGMGAAYEAHNKLREGTVANPNMQDQGFEVTGSYN